MNLQLELSDELAEHFKFKTNIHNIPPRAKGRYRRRTVGRPTDRHLTSVVQPSSFLKLGVRITVPNYVIANVIKNGMEKKD